MADTSTCPAQDDRPCTNHGQCDMGTCVCDPGYTYLDCSIGESVFLLHPRSRSDCVSFSPIAHSAKVKMGVFGNVAGAPVPSMSDPSPFLRALVPLVNTVSHFSINVTVLQFHQTHRPFFVALFLKNASFFVNIHLRAASRRPARAHVGCSPHRHVGHFRRCARHPR